ncbi:MAG: twin-arginine translocation signal domain-containing protein, partial [Planctomycetota bacterium]
MAEHINRRNFLKNTIISSTGAAALFCLNQKATASEE